jgi:glutamyl-tRNA reductase
MLARGKSAEEALAFLAHGLTNKLLHAPSAALRDATLAGDLDLLHAAERLYRLDESGEQVADGDK